MTTSARKLRLLHTAGALLMIINSAILGYSRTIRAEIASSGITNGQIDFVVISGIVIGGATLVYYLIIGRFSLDETVERLDSKGKDKTI